MVQLTPGETAPLRNVFLAMESGIADNAAAFYKQTNYRRVISICFAFL